MASQLQTGSVDLPIPVHSDGLSYHHPLLSLRLFHVLWFGLLTAVGAFWAYYRVFSGFSRYDDEGSLMASTKQFIQGQRLYDEIFSPYGPVYYFYEKLLHKLTATPVTHDVVRLSGLIPWMLTSLICAWIVLRLTDSLLLATLTDLITVLTLALFANEPGHPQEICMLMLVLLAASGVLVAQGQRTLGYVLMGALPAALLLVKVNLGIFAILAVALTLTLHTRLTFFSRLFSVLSFAAAFVLPYLLMQHKFADSSARVYCALVTAAVGAIGLVAFRANRSNIVAGAEFRVAVFSFLLMLGAILGTLLAQGSTWGATLYCLVLLHLHTSVNGTWYIPAGLGEGWLFWALSGLVVAGGFVVLQRKHKALAELWLFPLELLYGLGVFAAQLTQDSAAFAFALPFCWLALYPSDQTGRSRLSLQRTLLCVITTIQALYAFPIAGSQAAFIRILFIVVAAVSIGDFLRWRRAHHALSQFDERMLRAFASIVAIGAVIGFASLARAQRRHYQALPALNLAGAKRIHLPAEQANTYRWLTRNIQSYCDTVVGLPELPSLNFWTGLVPPGGLNIDGWVLVLSDAQQNNIESALAAHARACAVYNPDIVSFWNPRGDDLSGLPLVRYIHSNFKVAGSFNNYFFLVRNQRDLAGIAESVVDSGAAP